MNADKKTALTIIGTNIFLFVGIFTFMLVYDPMQIFHKSFRSEMRVHYNMRLQAAGIINNYDFDSIIFGTSMLENTSSLEASNYLGGKFVNISMSASDFFERKHVIEYLLARKNIKNIVYSIDDNFIERREGHPEYHFSSFDYLYDNNPINDIKAYLNIVFVKCLVKEVINHPTLDECIGKKTTLDRPSAWFTDPSHQMRFGGLDKWFEADNNNQILEVFSEIIKKVNNNQPDSQNLKNLQEEIILVNNYLKKYILDLAKAYPDTNFSFVFPPYSRAKFALWAKHEKIKFRIYKEALAFLVRESESISNIKFFGFEDQAFLDDVANYKDLSHYHQKYNSLMLEWMRDEKGHLHPENLDEYLSIIEKRALDYDLKSLSDRIQNYLNSMAI